MAHLVPSTEYDVRLKATNHRPEMANFSEYISTTAKTKGRIFLQESIFLMSSPCSMYNMLSKAEHLPYQIKKYEEIVHVALDNSNIFDQ